MEIQCILECLYSCILGPQARTKEGEVWVWQVREEQEGEDEMLVIIFATIGNLQHLGRADMWSGDGTFTV